MGKPSAFPQDVWDTAVALADDCYVDFSPTNGAIAIARAIMAERATFRPPLPEHVVILATKMSDATGVRCTAISSRIFGESKKIDLLIEGADLTLRRYRDALGWFSNNWPDGLAWPDEFARPIRKREG